MDNLEMPSSVLLLIALQLCRANTQVSGLQPLSFPRPLNKNKSAAIATATTAMVADIVPTTTMLKQPPPPPPLTAANGEKRNKKRRRGPFDFIKAAVLIMRHMRTKKQKQVVKEKVVSNNNIILKKLLGTARPGHFQANQSPLPNLPAVEPHAFNMYNVDDENNNNLMLAPLECPSCTSFSSSSTSFSQYQSVENLYEGIEKGSDGGYVSDHHQGGGGSIALDSPGRLGNLSDTCYASPLSQLGLDLSGDLTEKDTEDEEGFDENVRDEMIDSKAEEFIAQFYQQIRLQSLKSLEQEQ